MRWVDLRWYHHLEIYAGIRPSTVIHLLHTPRSLPKLCLLLNTATTPLEDWFFLSFRINKFDFLFRLMGTVQFRVRGNKESNLVATEFVRYWCTPDSCKSDARRFYLGLCDNHEPITIFRPMTKTVRRILTPLWWVVWFDKKIQSCIFQTECKMNANVHTYVHIYLGCCAYEHTGTYHMYYYIWHVAWPSEKKNNEVGTTQKSL